MRVFLTGGTGFIGQRLVDRLAARGDQPVVLSRDAGKAQELWVHKNIEYVQGNPAEPGPWMAAVNGCQAVINLAGESVFGKRWSVKQKQVLHTSRVDATTNLVHAIGAAPQRPQVMVSTSAIGFYGPSLSSLVSETNIEDSPSVSETNIENSPAGGDFLASLAVAWEKAAAPVTALGVRLAVIRVGVVLEKHGGALQQLLPPFKLGLGGPVGSGEQWVSWIHLDDIVGIYLQALDNPQAAGVFNGTAPEPVRNEDLSLRLAAILRRPCVMRVPVPALRLLLGEAADVVATGQKVIPGRSKELGYAFRFPGLDAALANIFSG